MFLILLSVLFIFMQNLSSAQGGLDETFGLNGKVTTNIAPSYSDYAKQVIVQKDGKIIVAGYAYNGPGESINFNMVRYNTDGSLDQTFGFGGKVITNIAIWQDAQPIAIRDDGMIYAIGYITNNQTFAMARYTSNGYLDKTFGNSGILTTDFGTTSVQGKTILIQNDGKILVGGYYSAGLNGFGFALMRFDSLGNLDPGFDNNGTSFNNLDGSINSLAIQNDGKIVAAGQIFGNPDYGIVRYKANGSLDSTFGSNGIAFTDFTNSFIANSVAIQKSGKIIVGGTTYNGSDNDFALARFNVNGSKDLNFGSNGKVNTDFNNSNDNGNSMAIQEDGKIIMAGFSLFLLVSDFSVARYDSNGTLLDNSFGTNGLVRAGYDDAEAYSVALQSNGNGGENIIIAGNVYLQETGGDFAVVNFNPDGSFNNSFGIDGKVTTDLGNAADIANSAVIQDDGKILLAGYTSGPSFTNVAIARYNVDGSLDTSFDKDGKVITNFGLRSSANAIAMLPNNKIVAVGNYMTSEMNDDFLISEYNQDGSPDATFQNKGSLTLDIAGKDDFANAVAVQSNGKILVAGYTRGTSNADFALLRLNTDGSLDMSFNNNGIRTTDLGLDDIGMSVMVQKDGKIIIAGYSFNGVNNDFAMVRFNSDGTYDNTFGDQGKVKTDIQNSNDLQSSAVLQSDGKIILAGRSTTMEGGVVLTMIRYNTNGTLDSTFNSNGKVTTNWDAPYGYPSSIVIQTDGKIDLLSNTHTGKDVDFAIVRYNSNGTLDRTFGIDGVSTIDFGNSDDVGLSILLQKDGKLIAAGYAANSYTSNFAVLRYNSTYPVFQISSQSLQFGNVFIDSSLTKSFSITNTGNADLQIDSIVSNNNVFNVSPNNAQIQPNDNQNINVTFKPKQVQDYTGKLIIYHNASGSPDTLSFTGSGKVNSKPVISLSVTELNFGEVPKNNSSFKNLIVKNKGTALLKIDSITIDNNNFKVDTLKSDISAGDSLILKVTFTPKDSIAYNGILKIYHNASGSPGVVNLTGKGTPQKIPYVVLSDSTLNFNLVTVNSSAKLKIKITNTGTAELQVDSITVAGNAFVVNPTAFILNPDSSKDVTVTFIPLSPTTYAAVLKIYHNANNSPTNVNLTGKGTNQKIPIITLSIKELKFGDVTVMSSLKTNFNIGNTGTADLKVDSIVSSSGIFMADPVNFIIKPDSSRNVTITFSPVDSIAYTGTLKIYHNAAESPGTINLTGNGVSPSKPIIKISSLSLAFSDVVIDSSKTLKLNIQNTGKVSLKVDSVKSSSANFITEQSGFIVKPDSNRNIQVTFTPKDSISYSGLLSIYHNASSELSTVSLSGKGIAASKAAISISTTALSFGDLLKGRSSTLNFNIKNTGLADLLVDSIKSNNSVFTVSPGSFIIKPDSVKNITVTFSPQDSIAYNGQLIIYSHISVSPAAINISGNGFIYPALLSANHAVSFGDVANINNYRILGIPGNSNIAVSSLVQGNYQYDWNVYDDNGNSQDYIVSNNNFKFSAGKAYWLISKSTININEQITSVQLNSDYTYSIPLHSNWNLISNPFEKNITWQNVKNLNGLPANSILYYWNGSVYSNPSIMVPYQGYYFNNTGNLTELKLHYEPHQTAGKISKTAVSSIDTGNFLELSVNDKKINQPSSVFFGIDSLSQQGIDNYDYYAPPADFQKVRINIVRNELPAREKYLFVEQRPELKEGQEFELEIKAVPNEPLNVAVKGTGNFSKYNIFLLDERLKNLYNLKEENTIKLNLAHQYNNFKLLIGTDEYLNQIKQQLNPAGYQLYQNYPNPFNPATIIRFSILKPENISLKVYNILGQLVKTLIENQMYEAGNHEIEFNGSNLASGIYIFRLESINFTMQRKMVMIK
ncbi:MAG: choice-of-anchor D domain-containing protein [Ignavibacteriaceae bacterium]